MKEEVKEKIKKILVIASFVIMTLLICFLSYDNPISKHEMGTDSKVFRYIVNGMSRGEAPYKDWFDHKGPILYIIDWIGININFGVINGIWMLQLVAIFLNFYFTQKILTKVFKLKNLESCVINFLVNINAIFFLAEGNLVETYVLPIITSTLYLILTVNKENFKKYNFLIGMLMGIVVLLKINMIALWMVYYVAVTLKCLKEKKWKEFGLIALYSFLGVMSVIAVMSIYMLIKGNFIEFIQDYIIFNVKYSTKNEIKISVMVKYFAKKSNLYLYYVVLASFLLSIIRKKGKLKCFSIALFILTWYLVIQPRNGYMHYGMTIVPTLIVPMVYLYEMLKESKKHNIKWKNIVNYTIRAFAIVAVCVVVLIIPVKTYSAIYKNVNIDQQDFSARNKMIENIKNDTNDDDKILVVGNDCDIYDKVGRRAASKYFYQYPIYLSDANILNSVGQDIINNKPKYIVFSKVHINADNKTLDKFFRLEMGNKYIQTEENNSYIVFRLK